MNNDMNIYDLTTAVKRYSPAKIEQAIQKYLAKARNKIIDILVTKYKMSENSALKVEESINNNVRSEMLTKYRFSEPFGTINELEYDRADTFLIRDYPDFVDWWFTAMIVPFYQSFGDTLGYNNGKWEFNKGEQNAKPEFANELIYEFIHLGGINDISIVGWRASDDTILYISTLKILSEKIKNIPQFGIDLKKSYLEAVPIIENRDPGITTMDSLKIQKYIEWNKLPYDAKHKGAGAAMRSGCIGIFFPGKHNRKKLIALAVECSRITHNSGIAILGSIVAALFTAYALEKVAINLWPHKLFELLKSKKIDEYMQKSRPDEYKAFEADKIIFMGQWEKYINIRFSGLKAKMDLPNMRHPVLRYDYLSKNFSKGCGMPGACGDDSVIFAYDALLESGNVVEKLIVYSILHPGDSDTVGSIAFSWFGAYYHSPKNQELLENKFEALEFYNELFRLFEKNIIKMAKVYYYDIYLNTARKFLRQLKNAK